MVWFYERQGTFTRCETRESPNRAGFELLMVEPDGTEQVEHYTDARSLEMRQIELQSTLVHDGWQGPFGRTI
jgi:hypothetical protein